MALSTLFLQLIRRKRAPFLLFSRFDLRFGAASKIAILGVSKFFQISTDRSQ